jgi:hypothetical protein
MRNGGLKHAFRLVKAATLSDSSTVNHMQTTRQNSSSMQLPRKSLAKLGVSPCSCSKGALVDMMTLKSGHDLTTFPTTVI